MIIVDLINNKFFNLIPDDAPLIQLRVAHKIIKI